MSSSKLSTECESFSAIFAVNPPPEEWPKNRSSYVPPKLEIIHPITRLLMTVEQPTELKPDIWRSYEAQKWAVCRMYKLKGKRHRSHNYKRKLELGKVWFKFHLIYKYPFLT